MVPYCHIKSMVALWPCGGILAQKEEEMEKKEVKTTLRYPQSVKEEFKRIAEEEGLSENSAIVQGLVWWLKYREKMQHAL